MKNYICIPFISLCLLSTTSEKVYAYKYGLGSCLDQDREQSIWSAIKKENVDGFIFLGDNVYGDIPSGKLSKMKTAYQTQKDRLPRWLMDEKDILAIWDDHDFGINDGGGDYPFKQESEKMFLDFWKVQNSDPRRKREGIYFKQTKIIEGVEIDIIGLDTRYFRSKLKGKNKAYQPNNDSSATILGQDQWDWLKSSIFNSSAEIIIILSSIQILATNHPYEKWDNFPLERNKLLNLMAIAAKDKTIIAVTGDRHKSGIYQNQDFVEITASSLNRPASRGKETDPLLIGNTYRVKNYGILNIEPSKNKITVSIHNKNGQKLNSKIINIY